MSLEIEIITTKKPLTLKLLKQMSQLSQHRVPMERCQVIGFIQYPSLNNGVKTALVWYNEEYFTLPLHSWKPGRTDSKAYAKLANGKYITRSFSTHKELETWLELFVLIKASALKTHIYI